MKSKIKMKRENKVKSTVNDLDTFEEGNNRHYVYGAYSQAHTYTLYNGN